MKELLVDGGKLNKLMEQQAGKIRSEVINNLKQTLAHEIKAKTPLDADTLPQSYILNGLSAEKNIQFQALKGKEEKIRKKEENELYTFFLYLTTTYQFIKEEFSEYIALCNIEKDIDVQKEDIDVQKEAKKEWIEKKLFSRAEDAIIHDEESPEIGGILQAIGKFRRDVSLGLYNKYDVKKDIGELLVSIDMKIEKLRKGEKLTS